MKIGIFGGCFNPPHKMHKNIPLELISKGYLDKVIYVPTNDNYEKKDLISNKDRCNMLKLMIYNNNDLSLEVNPDLKYTYQTLDYFKNIYKEAEIYFICGSDNLKEFDTWKNYQYILTNYKLLVIKRNNDNINALLKKYQKYKDNIIITNINSEIVSSTYLREKIRESNLEEISKYIDNNVYQYIKEKNLYIENMC